MNQRPVVFKWRHFEPQIILCAVRWYLRFSLSYRQVEELLVERAITVDHSTIWRWVQRFAPELNVGVRRHLKPTNLSWRVDETYVRVKGQWCYRYRYRLTRGDHRVLLSRIQGSGCNQEPVSQGVGRWRSSPTAGDQH